ncbi:MAG TPA: hypothetical protein VFX16_12870 [Pseudonocardiaceae bacterium]|nr:hypothetical protein [Pseudonocardiaceae bacterium]
MTTAAWTARFGPARWPRTMNAHTYPFLTALAVPELGQVNLPDLNGTPVPVRVDVCQTPYRSFVLLWTPQRRRLLPRRKFLIAP